MNKTKHDWVGKMIYSELYKKLKFDYKKNQSMRNQEYILENDTHNLL